MARRERRRTMLVSRRFKVCYGSARQRFILRSRPRRKLAKGAIGSHGTSRCCLVRIASYTSRMRDPLTNVRGVVPLASYERVEPAPPPRDHLPFAFRLIAKGGNPDGSFVFAAPTESERTYDQSAIICARRSGGGSVESRADAGAYAALPAGRRQRGAASRAARSSRATRARWAACRLRLDFVRATASRFNFIMRFY